MNYALEQLTLNVPLQDIERNINFNWSKTAFLFREDATERVASLMGCTNINKRFHEPSLSYLHLNDNYNFDEKMKFLKDNVHKRIEILCKYGTLDQIIKYKGDADITKYTRELSERSDLTLQFWSKISKHKIRTELINSFDYENLKVYAPIYTRYLSFDVFCCHRNVRLIDLYDDINTNFILRYLAQTLCYEDIMKIGIDKFDPHFFFYNPCINQLIQHINLSSTKINSTSFLTLDSIQTFRIANVDYRSNILISLKDVEKKYNTANRIFSRPIDEVRLYCDNLKNDYLIAYNPNVTLRDYTLCIDGFYDILKRNVIPMLINRNKYLDVYIYIL